MPSKTVVQLRPSQARKPEVMLSQVASILGREAEEFVSRALKYHEGQVEYFLCLLSNALSKDKSKYELGSKVASFAALGLYLHQPWPNDNRKAFHNWCRQAEMFADEGPYLFSLINEFKAWEPAEAEDFAQCILLDRAIVRSARVGATSLEPQAFFSWLAENFEHLTDGQKYFDEVRRINQLMKSPEHSASDISSARDRLEFIAQRVLRDVGAKHGRTGLNAVRRTIGAPPVARRKPIVSTIGADYSENVQMLLSSYELLTPGEREAFKVLVKGVDSSSC